MLVLPLLNRSTPTLLHRYPPDKQLALGTGESKLVSLLSQWQVQLLAVCISNSWVVVGTAQPRIGRVLDVLLENGKKSILVDLEVANLDGNEKLILGLDIFPKLGFKITGIPFHQPEKSDSDLSIKSVKNFLSAELHYVPETLTTPFNLQ